MKKSLTLTAILASLGAVGCTSTSGDRYRADQPPPISRNVRPAVGNAPPGPAVPAEATELDPVKLPPAQTRLTPEDIDADNYQDSLRKLESEMKVEKRAMTQAR